jgi:cholesterol transport system auxiliary component
MRFSLHRGPTHQLVATKEMSVSEPMRGRTAYAGVIAANVAIEKLLRAFAVFAISNAN